MNLKKLGRTLGMVAAVAIMAMVLQGCGGDDDNSSVEQDLRAQIEDLQGDLTAANTAKTAAETAQAAAEAAQAAAEAAQAEAEEAQATAEARRDTAVAERAAALAAQMVAETAQADAETAQMAAETAQATAEAAQMTAETERDAANVAKMMAEEAQADAETAQAAAEAAQADAEAAQMMAEADAEAAQMAAEEAQMAAAAAVEEAEMMAAEAIAAAEAAAAAETAAAQAAAEAAAEAQAAAEAEAAAAEAAQMAAAEAQAAAEAETAAAEAAVMEAAASVEAAQAAQAAAEADKMAADEARMQAEADLATAQAAQAAAEALQAVAEDRATAAETAQTAAEAAQATAETAQAAAEEAQATAEAAQAAAEEAQAAAEAALDSGVAEALAAQQAAETERDEANAAKMAAEEAQATAEAAQMAAETAQATAEAAQMAAETARDNALAAKETAEDNLGAANTALTQANAALAQANTDLAAARADATKYKEMYEEAKKQLDAGGGPGTGTAMHEAATMAAVALNNLLTRNANPTFGSVSMGCSTPSGQSNTTCVANDVVTVRSVAREGSNLTFMVTEGTGTGTNTGAAADATLFDTAKHSPTSVSAPSGWMAVAMANGPTGGVTNRAVVYTNIEAPKRVAFNGPKLERDVNNNDTLTDVGDADWNVVGEYLSINLDTFANKADDTANDNPNVKLALPSNLTFSSANRANAAPSTSYAGTYDGAAGMYICTSVTVGNCGWRRNEVNDVTYVVAYGIWEFRPASGAQTVSEDTDYLVFGAWLNESVASSAARNAGVFANGSDLFTAGNINGLEGKATYSGPASGNYAKRLSRSTMAAAGRFTATATLTADFGAANAGGTIKGSVNDFVIPIPVDGIVDSNPNWVVTLGGTNTDESVNISADNNQTTGTSGGNADGVNWSGTWGAQFFGDTPNEADAHPTGIAGVFRALQVNPVATIDDSPNPAYNPNFPEVRRLTTGNEIHHADQGFVGVVGAFGAELQD